MRKSCFITGVFATEAFEDVGHSSDARELMADFHIGSLAAVSMKIESLINAFCQVSILLSMLCLFICHSVMSWENDVNLHFAQFAKSILTCLTTCVFKIHILWTQNTFSVFIENFNEWIWESEISKLFVRFSYMQAARAFQLYWSLRKHHILWPLFG